MYEVDGQNRFRYGDCRWMGIRRDEHPVSEQEIIFSLLIIDHTNETVPISLELLLCKICVVSSVVIGRNCKTSGVFCWECRLLINANQSINQPTGSWQPKTNNANHITQKSDFFVCCTEYTQVNVEQKLYKKQQVHTRKVKIKHETRRLPGECHYTHESTQSNNQWPASIIKCHVQ